MDVVDRSIWQERMEKAKCRIESGHVAEGLSMQQNWFCYLIIVVK